MSEIGDKLLELRELKSSRLRDGGSGSSSGECYRVEARMAVGCGPKIFKTGCYADLKLTDMEWSTISFPKSAVGVTPGSPWDEFTHHGFLSYQAAQALRWWWLADNGGMTFADTRLVKYKFSSSWTAEPLEAQCLISTEKREDIMPDWNTKPKKPVVEVKEVSDGSGG